MFPACLRSAIEPGEALRLDGPETQGVPIAVFHTDDGEFFAVDDTCTHQDASLAEGWLEGCEVESPLHPSKFDLRTGAVDAPPAKRPIRTHQANIEGHTVYIGCGGVGAAAVAGSRLAGANRIIAVDLDDRKLAKATGDDAECVVIDAPPPMPPAGIPRRRRRASRPGSWRRTGAQER